MILECIFITVLMCGYVTKFKLCSKLIFLCKFFL